jgi:hypothetical protein
MGVPIDNFENENRQLYDRLLNIAYKLSNGITSYSIPINDLNAYYLENQNIQIPRYMESNINTLPELYAESLAFLQNRNIMTGVYALVDIGGGTVDMAIMFKEAPNKFSIVSKDIIPLGIEIIANNIVTSKNNVDLVRNDLKERRIFSSLYYVSNEREIKYKVTLNRAFATIVLDLKKKDVQSNFEHVLYLNNRTLPIIICGGGANYKWYEDGILETRAQLRPILKDGLKLKIVAIEDMLTNITSHHRLLIANTLAQPVEYIPQLAGFPWHFQEKNYIPTKEDTSNRDYSLQEKMKELYGDHL